MHKLNTQVTANDESLARIFLQNQVVPLEKSYHYETTGIIHGFGFGPVYKLNEHTKHSIEKFTKSKFPNTHFFLLI